MSETMFLVRLCNRGLYAVRTGVLLRRMAREHGYYPTPLTPDFVFDLACRIALHGKQWRWRNANFRIAVESCFERIMARLEDPAKPVKSPAHLVDWVLAKHQIAPFPKVVEDVPSPSPPMSQEEIAVRKMIQSIIDGEE